MFNSLGYQWALLIACFLDFGHAAFPVGAVSGTFFVEIVANLAQGHFPPVWKKLEGEKQVRFRISALAMIILL